MSLYANGSSNSAAGKVFLNADLGISTTITSAGTSTSPAILCPVSPVTAIVLLALSSGQGSLKVSVHSGTPDFGSPTASVSITDTKLYALKVNTTSSLTQVSFRVTETQAGGNTCGVASVAVMVLGALTAGEDWSSIISGLNAVGSPLTGDGSGTFSISA